MPHVIVECSANLDALVDLDEVLRHLHESALSTGVFPLGGIRTRVHVVDHYRIADGNPANAFVHVEMAIGQGRDLPTRRRAAETVFHALCAVMDRTAAGRPLALSLELRELERETSFRRNNIHDRLTQPAASRAR
jgi:5-carboxymethyl-2-hydroxymuconate isomerase